jgi:cytochrome c peroxidase
LKVPSLRNVAMTAPYFHDGSLMAFLDTLTGQLPANLIAPPTLP